MNKLKTSLVALVLVSTNYITAQTLVKAQNENQVRVSVAKEEKAISLKLLDAYEVELFSEALPEADHQRNLSLENLPKGTYSVKIEGSQKLTTQALTKTETGIVVGKADVIFKPSFKRMGENEQLVRLTFKNPYPKRSSVKVYDKFGELVIKLTNEDVFFNKIFDFSEVPNGEYSIAISTEAGNFVEKINIKR